MEVENVTEKRGDSEKEQHDILVESAPSTAYGTKSRDVVILNEQYVKLGWKTWLVIFITCFG